MPAASIIPPAASLCQILRACCASGPTADPALMQPFIGPGKRAGQAVTAATDGKTICLWTAGRVGLFKEWSALQPSTLRPGENGTSPLAKFRPLFGTPGLHPLALARRQKSGSWTIQILTSRALIPDRTRQILAHADSCYLGPSPAPQINGWESALAVRASVGKSLLHGVIICPTPA